MFENVHSTWEKHEILQCHNKEWRQSNISKTSNDAIMITLKGLPGCFFIRTSLLKSSNNLEPIFMKWISPFVYCWFIMTMGLCKHFSALCTKCLHRPIVIINQQYTKGEIHFIYLHYFQGFGFCFIDCYHGNGCVSLENPTVCTVNGRA